MSEVVHGPGIMLTNEVVARVEEGLKVDGGGTECWRRQEREKKIMGVRIGGEECTGKEEGERKKGCWR